jgi:hypothetical protein
LRLVPRYHIRNDERAALPQQVVIELHIVFRNSHIECVFGDIPCRRSRGGTAESQRSRCAHSDCKHGSHAGHKKASYRRTAQSGARAYGSADHRAHGLPHPVRFGVRGGNGLKLLFSGSSAASIRQFAA